MASRGRIYATSLASVRNSEVWIRVDLSAPPQGGQRARERSRASQHGARADSFLSAPGGPNRDAGRTISWAVREYLTAQ